MRAPAGHEAVSLSADGDADSDGLRNASLAVSGEEVLLLTRGGRGVRLELASSRRTRLAFLALQTRSGGFTKVSEEQ